MSEETPERGRSWLRWILYPLVVVLLVLVIMPPLLGQRRKGDLAKAMQNVSSIGYAMFNFENDFGCYPNDETVKDLDEDAILSSAGGSNYYLSQLIAGGYVDQEGPFFANTGYTIYPDNDKSTPDRLLSHQEVGFSFVVWESSKDLPRDAPLMFAFLSRDKKAEWTSGSIIPFTGPKLVVLRHDLAVDDLSAKSDGTVMLNGKDYFDWSQPHWGGQKPKIVYPE